MICAEVDPGKIELGLTSPWRGLRCGFRAHAVLLLTFVLFLFPAFCRAQQSQTIVFTQPPPAQAYAGTSVVLAATASSGLPVTFSVASGPAQVSGTNGSTLTFTGVGTVVVQADQAGGSGYSAAPPVEASTNATLLTERGEYGFASGSDSRYVYNRWNTRAGVCADAGGGEPRLQPFHCGGSGAFAVCCGCGLHGGANVFAAVCFYADAAGHSLRRPYAERRCREPAG